MRFIGVTTEGLDVEVLGRQAGGGGPLRRTSSVHASGPQT